MLLVRPRHRSLVKSCGRAVVSSTVRIAITGAGGNIGRGLVPRLTAAGHQLVLSDLHPVEGLAAEARFVAADVRSGEGLAEAVHGADVLVHLPAWHGVHLVDHSETEFWELNVDGTFRALQAAVAAGISKVVWLSSQAWNDSRGTYGFTKVIGEQLLDYHRVRHGISYVSIRPANLTPWTDWAGDYGRELLYGRVDRDDVLDCVELSIDYVASHDAGLIVDALHPDVVSENALREWQGDPMGVAEQLFPGAHDVVDRFGLDITPLPHRPARRGWTEIGYTPRRHFGTWVDSVANLTDEEVRDRTSDY